jgi:uncharacterized membrane protein required for colicin V production
MNWVDLTFITIIGYNGLTGFKRGLVRLLMDIIAFALAIRFSSHYGGAVAKWAETSLSQAPPISTFVGYIGVWLATFGVLSVIGMWLSSVLPMIGLGSFNRIGGVIGGTIKGILICLPILMPLQFFKPELLKNSVFAPALAPAASTLGEKLFPKGESQELMDPALLLQ